MGELTDAEDIREEALGWFVEVLASINHVVTAMKQQILLISPTQNQLW